MDKFYLLDKKTEQLVSKMKGPILIFGAGGFIGMNLLKSLLLYRKDVFGVSHKKNANWRFSFGNISSGNILDCDIDDDDRLKKLILEVYPQTVFNLAAYGAYPKQKDFKRIYDINFNSTVQIIERLKESNFGVYVHAGSQSEYGLITRGPKEGSELIPNSHYAVSKVADYYALKYYGKVEKLPVAHLRLYSVYGPWEEPDRLMPVLLSKARKNLFPNFVEASISRDFIHVKDVVRAFIFVAAKMNEEMYGEAFNVGTEKKTTIYDLAHLTKELFHIEKDPVFGTMQNRVWDLKDWYSNSKKIEDFVGWKYSVDLKTGLLDNAKWQDEIKYDDIVKHWQK